MSNSRIKVAIVEDSAEICRELGLLIAQTGDMECCAPCRNATSALQTLPAIKPDVIVMDVQLPGRSGIQCVELLKPLVPDSQILMFTIADEAHVIMSAITAGAIGYLLKNSSGAEIVAGIRSAHRKEAPLSPGVSRKVVENIHRTAPRPTLLTRLTFREEEIVRLVSQGQGDKQIADALKISLLTVNTHLKNVYAKLGVHSRTELSVKYLGLQKLS